MPLPTTTLALFDLLAADTVLTPLLGVHQLKTGTTRPALAHFFPRETIEPDTRPAGVEVVVWRGPAGTAAMPCQTGEIDLRPTFRLSVVQWEPLPGGALNQLAVINRLLQLLPGANAADTTIDGLTAGLQQHTVTWICPVAVLQP